MDGSTLADIANTFPTSFIKFNRGIERLITIKTKDRDPNVEPKILIYWGESGTGKTRKAVEEFPEAYILTKPNADGNLWWDNYSGQETVIFDEFYGWIKYDLLLRVLDRYPLQVPIKGGFCKLTATRFIFTSNKDWKDWYPNIDDTSAFERRISEWGKVTRFRKLAQWDAAEVMNHAEQIMEDQAERNEAKLDRLVIRMQGIGAGAGAQWGF